MFHGVTGWRPQLAPTPGSRGEDIPVTPTFGLLGAEKQPQPEYLLCSGSRAPLFHPSGRAAHPALAASHSRGGAGLALGVQHHGQRPKQPLCACSKARPGRLHRGQRLVVWWCVGDGSIRQTQLSREGPWRRRGCRREERSRPVRLRSQGGSGGGTRGEITQEQI